MNWSYKKYVRKSSPRCDAAQIRKVHSFDVLSEVAEVELINSPIGERVQVTAWDVPKRFDFVVGWGETAVHTKKEEFLSRWSEIKNG